jgi:hypothetical protein
MAVISILAGAILIAGLSAIGSATNRALASTIDIGAPALISPPATPTFNVMDYGAKHDGVTDDAPAIMRAMLAARAAGGGSVYLPAGTYRLDQGYDLPGTGTTPENWHGVNQSIKVNVPVFTGCTVYGDGATKTILNNVNGDSRNTMGAVFQNNLCIHDLAVTSPSLAASGSVSKDGYKLMGCSSSSIYNTRTSNFYIGLNYSGTSNCTFTNMINTNCLKPFSARTTTWAASAGGADYMSISNITFTNCEASYASSTQSDAWGFCAYKYGADEMAHTGATISNITLNGCSSHNNGDSGVFFQYGDHITITNSNFSNNGSEGSLLRDETNYWWNGNTGSGNGGAFLLAERSAVRGSL